MGSVPESQAVAAVQTAVDAGMTFIDTAESYRTSESIIGKALMGRRHEVFLATKLSGDHSPDHWHRPSKTASGPGDRPRRPLPAPRAQA